MKTRTVIVSIAVATAALLLLAEATDPAVAAESESAAAPAAKTTARYTITALAAPIGDCQAYAVNARGEVAGIAYDQGNEGRARGFLWSAGEFRFLSPLEGGAATQFYAVNDEGTVAGWGLDAAGKSRAIDAEGGSTNAARPLAANSAGARAINARGDVGGTLGSEHGFERAFVADAKGRVTVLATLGGSASRGFGLNGAGMLVGDAGLSGDAVTHAFAWNPSAKRMIDLGALVAGRNSVAYAVNGNGVAVGAAEDAQGQVVPVRFAAGKVEALALRAGRAFAVNASGDIAGAWNDSHAFAVVGDELLDLEAEIGEDSGWRLLDARGINDAGVIVGWGLHEGHMMGFVLTPTGDAAAMTAAEPAAAAGAVLRFRAEPSVTNGRTTLAFGLPSPGRSRVTLYSVAGRQLRAIDVDPGQASVVWDGRDDTGRVVGSGVLLGRLDGALGHAVTRLVVVR